MAFRTLSITLKIPSFENRSASPNMVNSLSFGDSDFCDCSKGADCPCYISLPPLSSLQLSLERVIKSLHRSVSLWVVWCCASMVDDVYFPHALDGFAVGVHPLVIMELLRSPLTVYPVLLENLGQRLGCGVLQWYCLCPLGKDAHHD